MPAPTLALSDGLRTSVIRGAGLAVAAVVLAAFHPPWRPQTLCLLRAVTGLPCPLCGTTTAAVDLGEGQVARAFLASPLAVLGILVLVVRPLVVDRLPRFTSRGALWTVIVSCAAASELWQLHRFALL